ncbi:hypothetical protein N0V82_008180 [Gnomoniopsis sp. IMI 355080]|nr:hypothetical protein N0V82_008180 [Gnomoniopsis sp. IMI 355080]
MDSKSGFRAGGTWYRYKLGQAQFTKWLKQTADKTTPAPADGVGGRPSLSRSAKKVQKKAAKSGVDEEVAIHWRELETMADNITTNANPEDIPSAPINILRDVIALRKKSARFFRRTVDSKGGEALRDKNATHEHIIQVLERVLAKFEALKARMPGTASAKGAERSRDGIDDLNNMFEHLEVQSSSYENEMDAGSDVENQLETTSSKTPKKAKKVGKKKLLKGIKPKKQPDPVPDPGWMDNIDFGLQTEEEEEEFDYYMMVYCFFEDFNLVRSYICERWCDYYFDRSISLNTLAVITNAAFELFHQMEHDLIMDMRRIGIRDRNMGQYEVMMMMIFAEMGMEHVDYDSYDGLSQAEKDDRMWKDEWEWLASPAFQTIQHLLRFIPPGKTSMIRKDDRSPIIYGATTPKELNQFKDAVIQDLLFDVACVKALKKNGGADDILPAESELLLGFQDALRNYDYSSAFIFSLQLYVDIRYILEDAVVRPFEQLQQTAKRISRDLPKQIDQASGPRSQLRRALRQREKELGRFMLHDVVLDDKLPRYLNAGLTEEDVEEFYLLKHEPVWASLLDFRAKLFMNELGHEFVHRSFVVEAGAYLYAAARASSSRFPGHEDLPAWPDMDKYLASYTPQSPFRSGILNGGADPAAILRSIEAIMPVDMTDPKPSNLSLDGVEGQTDEFKQAVRIRQHLSQRYTSEDRTNQFFMQYMQRLIRLRLEPEMRKLESSDVATTLQDIAHNKPGALPHHLTGALSDDKKALAEERIKLREKQRATQRRAELSQLSPVQQIQILEDTVTSQLEGLLSIDFMGLFQRSYAMLLAVCMTQPESFKEAVGYRREPQSTFPDRLARVPLMIGEILTGSAVEDEKVLWNVYDSVRAVVNSDLGAMLDGGTWDGTEAK